MKKTLSVLSVAVVALLMLPISTKAFTVSPDSGSYSPGAEQTIAIIANPPAETSTLQLRISVMGATVVPGSVITSAAEENGYLFIGVCPGGTGIKYTSSSLCIDIAKSSGTIANGDLLGQFKIRFNEGVTSATLVTAVENGYLIGSDVLPDVGRGLGSYTVSVANTPTPTNLPVTGISDYPGLVIVGGVFLVFVGVGFFIMRSRSQNLQS